MIRSFRETGLMLSALPTIDRYMANGTLKRIRYSAHSVRITQESVHNLMEGGAA